MMAICIACARNIHSVVKCVNTARTKSKTSANHSADNCLNTAAIQLMAAQFDNTAQWRIQLEFNNQ